MDITQWARKLDLATRRGDLVARANLEAVFGYNDRFLDEGGHDEDTALDHARLDRMQAELSTQEVH